VPLPRGQSGFVPIADPRLTYEKHEKQENTSRSFNVNNTGTTISPVQEERFRKNGNSTVTKVEKIISKIGKPPMNFREREGLSTAPTFVRSTGFESRKIFSNVNKTR